MLLPMNRMKRYVPWFSVSNAVVYAINPLQDILSILGILKTDFKVTEQVIRVSGSRSSV